MLWWAFLSQIEPNLTRSRKQGSRGPHRVHLGPVGPRWVPGGPHEPCYQGMLWPCNLFSIPLMVDDVWNSNAYQSRHLYQTYIIPWNSCVAHNAMSVNIYGDRVNHTLQIFSNYMIAPGTKVYISSAKFSVITPEVYREPFINYPTSNLILIETTLRPSCAFFEQKACDKFCLNSTFCLVWKMYVTWHRSLPHFHLRDSENPGNPTSCIEHWFIWLETLDITGKGGIRTLFCVCK